MVTTPLRGYLPLLLLPALAASGCASGGSDTDLEGGKDQGEYLTFLNNTSRSWSVAYGPGSHSNQYTVDGRSASASGVLSPGQQVDLGWQGSAANAWSQQFDLPGMGFLKLFGHNYYPSCTNVVDRTVSGDIWICPYGADGLAGVPFTVVAAVQYVSPPGHKGKGYWGFVEFRDRYELPPMNAWMASIPDTARLGDISIPGTHDSATWNSSHADARTQAREMDFTAQLNWGVRVFDLRLSQNMNFFHTYFLNLTLRDFLEPVVRFLESHPTEFVVALIEDDECDKGTTTFDPNFRDQASLYGGGSVRYETGTQSRLLEDPISGLRGTIVVVTRSKAAGGCGYVRGAPQINWSDDATVNPTPSNCKVPPCIVVALSDEYSATCVDKAPRLLRHLGQAAADTSGRWFIGHTSGYNMGGAFPEPQTYAEMMGPGTWEAVLGGRGMLFFTSPDDSGWVEVDASVSRSGKLGTVMMDYVGYYNSNDIRDDLIRRNIGK